MTKIEQDRMQEALTELIAVFNSGEMITYEQVFTINCLLDGLDVPSIVLDIA